MKNEVPKPESHPVIKVIENLDCDFIGVRDTVEQLYELSWEWILEFQEIMKNV